MSNLALTMYTVLSSPVRRNVLSSSKGLPIVTENVLSLASVMRMVVALSAPSPAVSSVMVESRSRYLRSRTFSANDLTVQLTALPATGSANRQSAYSPGVSCFSARVKTTFSLPGCSSSIRTISVSGLGSNRSRVVCGSAFPLSTAGGSGFQIRKMPIPTTTTINKASVVL